MSYKMSLLKVDNDCSESKPEQVYFSVLKPKALNSNKQSLQDKQQRHDVHVLQLEVNKYRFKTFLPWV